MKKYNSNKRYFPTGHLQTSHSRVRKTLNFTLIELLVACHAIVSSVSFRFGRSSWKLKSAVRFKRSTARLTSFTLIELLVVIVIIALLAGLILPVLAKAKGKARSASCVNNLKQISEANHVYAAEYQRYVPHRGGASWNKGCFWHGYRVNSSDDWDPRKGSLSDYLGENRQVKECPEANLARDSGEFAVNGTGGYGYNSYGVGSTAYLVGYGTGNASACWDGGGMRPEHIALPEKTVMFGDAANFIWATTTLAEKDEILPPYSPWDVPIVNLKTKTIPPGVKNYGVTHFRHPGRMANIAWVDGHISAEKIAFSWMWGGADDPNRDAANLGNFSPQDNTLWDPWTDDIPDS